jgi:hypothetical protein
MDQKSVPGKAAAEQVFKDTRRQTRWQEKDPYRARGAGGRGPSRPRCNGAFYLKVVQNYQTNNFLPAHIRRSRHRGVTPRALVQPFLCADPKSSGIDDVLRRLWSSVPPPGNQKRSSYALSRFAPQASVRAPARGQPPKPRPA